MCRVCRTGERMCDETNDDWTNRRTEAQRTLNALSYHCICMYVCGCVFKLLQCKQCIDLSKTFSLKLKRFTNEYNVHLFQAVLQRLKCN